MVLRRVVMDVYDAAIVEPELVANRDPEQAFEWVLLSSRS
jgi:hypothetical protein